MLTDNYNLKEEKRLPCDGTWIPEAGDLERSVRIAFEVPTDMAQIVLYDDPSEEHNVLDAVIRFDDGTGVSTGPLDPGGAATRINVEKTGVSGFELILMETEGDRAGLTEIEAFREPAASGICWIKLMDMEGHFAYDYWTTPKGNAQLQLYTFGYIPEKLSVSCNNSECAAVLENGKLTVTCPTGESAVVTVSDVDAGVSDSIVITNPNILLRLRHLLGQKMEQFFFQRYLDGAWWNTVTYEMLDILRYKLEALLP